MIDYFNNLYDDVFEYAYESLTDDIVYNGYIITEATGEGVILTEAKSGKKKRKTKKDVFKLIRNTTIIIVLALGLIKLIKKVVNDKISKIKADSEYTGYIKGYKKGHEKGQKAGYDEGNYYGYHKGYKKGKEEGYETGRSEGWKRGKDIGDSKGYHRGMNDGYEKGRDFGYSEAIRDLGNKSKADQIKKGSDEYYARIINDMTKTVMKNDPRIAKRNGGKSVYNGNDIIKTLDAYIKVLRAQNKRLKNCKGQIQRIETNDNYIEEFSAYKEVFEIAKSTKVVSGKVIMIGKKFDVPIPDELKQKLEEL